MRRVALLAAIAAAVVVLLAALDLVSFGSLLGGRGADTGEGAVDPLTGRAPDDAAPGPTLTGSPRAATSATRDPAAAAPPPGPGPLARGSVAGGASLVGRVVHDGSGAPAADVAVHLLRPDTIAHYLRAPRQDRNDVLEARTGPDGRFALKDLIPADGYVVRGRLPGHAAVSSAPVDLRGGERVDLGDLRIGPGGRIALRVEDGAQAPLAGVDVAATWQVTNVLGVILADPDTLEEVEARATTAADGRVVIGHLEPGVKTLVVRAPDGASDVVREVTVRAGETTDAGTLALDGRGVLADTVAWDDGRPIAGARVFAGVNQRVALHTVETDANGRFRLEHLQDGPQVVGVLVPGLPVRILMGKAIGTEDLRVVFPQAGSLVGRVVSQATGDPVTTFSVKVARESIEDWQERFIDQLVTQALGGTRFVDPDGRFAFAARGPGTYQVVVSAPGFPDTTVGGVVVPPGGASDAVRIELPQGRGATGTVRAGATGPPLAGARLYVLREGDEDEEPGGDASQVADEMADRVGDMAPACTSDADGRFELPGQAPGTFTLVATHPEARPAFVRGIDLERTPGPFALVLQPAGRLTVEVRLDDGRPAAGQSVLVLARGETSPRGAEVDAQGRARIERVPTGRLLVLPALPSRLRLVVARQATEDPAEAERLYEELHALAGRELLLSAGDDLTVHVRMPRLTQVEGVLRRAGTPVSTDTGVYIADGRSFGLWCPAAEGGRYTALLEPGPYQAWLIDDDRSWSTSPLEVPDAPQARIDIER